MNLKLISVKNVEGQRVLIDPMDISSVLEITHRPKGDNPLVTCKVAMKNSVRHVVTCSSDNLLLAAKKALEPASDVEIYTIDEDGSVEGEML